MTAKLAITMLICALAITTHANMDAGLDAYVDRLMEQRAPNLTETMAIMQGKHLSEYVEPDFRAPEKELWWVESESDDLMHVTTTVKWDVGAMIQWAKSVQPPTTLRDVPSQYAMRLVPAYGYTEGQMYAALSEGQPDAAGRLEETETEKKPGVASTIGTHFSENKVPYGVAATGLGGVVLGYNARSSSGKSGEEQARQAGGDGTVNVGGDVNAPIIINNSSSGDPQNSSNTGSGGQHNPGG